MRTPVAKRVEGLQQPFHRILVMPHIAFATDPRHWTFGTTITRDTRGEYRWWLCGPLAFCWA